MRANLAVAVVLAAISFSIQADDDAFEIVSLSNRADLISGGDALVEVRVPKGTPLSRVKLRLNDSDVTAAFIGQAGGRALRGLLTGLVEGRNDFSAQIDGPGRGDGRRENLVITNHPIGGPILSGPQVVPFFCATPVPQGATATSPTTNASGLTTAAFDAQCNIATEFKLYYRTTSSCQNRLPDPSPNTTNFLNPAPPLTALPPADACFKTYNPASPPPATEVAQTTTDTGLTVPYIVRVERGTMNRGIFDLAVLYNPAQPWSATAPQAQWNGKILYQFGASTGQPRRQSRTTSNWMNELGLARGYLVAQNSMTDSVQNSNRVSMTETVMMMKEHIGDRYGPVKFTMGTGCSGGSINSNMNASIAPGQLDGITVSCAYPDSETTGIEVNECVLLVEAYQQPAWLNLMTSTGQTQVQINAKKAAINGHVDQTGCHGWYNAFGSNGKVGNYVQRLVLSNTTGAVGTLPPPAPQSQPTNNCQLPLGLVYDPITNPTGARCSAWDWAQSIWGKAEGRPGANETRDNVGVQYGLKALLSGAITTEEFVTLNEIVGGIDKDSNFQAARSVADPAALDIAYRAGIVMSGRNLAKTAVIDMRGWDDSSIIIPPGLTIPSTTIPIHYVWRSFSIRERLDREFGDHDNQVMWRFGRFGFFPSAALQGQALSTMDLWLTNLKADASHQGIERKVRDAKPASAFDFCLLSSEAAQTTQVTDPVVCDTDPFLKPHASPRQVAGGPLSENILKCQLKPLSSADYAPLVFSPAQWARLEAVFRDGVCDWDQPGVGQRPAVSPRDYSDGPGGERLPRAPDSN
jgi:hypothetical protein